MGRLTNEIKKNLYDIEKARIDLSIYLKNGFITDDDIIGLNNVDYNYGLKKDKDIKEQKLRLIYACPFLLCDQEFASGNIKKLLPALLEYRYNMELRELQDEYELGFFSIKELNEQKKKLKYIYYNSTVDGKNILKTGNCKGIKNKVLILK